MKSIFRKIAFVLALAMVVTLFPVMSASAANNGNKYARTKDATLYVGGDANGDYESCWSASAKGKKLKTEEKYKIEYVSSEPSVATVSKYGLVEAKSVGSTKITVTFTKKGEKTIEESFNVTVKKNAANIELDKESQDALKAGLTAGDKLTLNANLTNEDGSSDGITDKVKFYCSSAADKEIIELNKDSGELTALKEGKATIVVQSCQYEYDRETGKYKTSVAKYAEYSVEVKEAGIVSAKQLNKNTVAITCGSAAAAADIVANKTNLKVTYKIGEQDIVGYINYNEVKVDGSDDKVVNVTLYDELVKDYEYTFKYGEKSAVVRGADLTAAAVASIRIATSTVPSGEFKDIAVKYYDSNNVELPAEKIETTGVTSFEIKGGDRDYFTLNGKQIYFLETRKTAILEASYIRGYKNDGNPDLIKSPSVTITSVDKSTEDNQIDGWAIKRTSDTKEIKNLDYSKDAKNIAVGDDLDVWHLYGRYYVTSYDGKKDARYTDDPNNSDYPVFEYTSTNDSVVMVNTNEGILHPVAAGSATIVVRRVYSETNKPVVGTCAINVVGSRMLTSFAATAEKNKLAIDQNSADQVKLTIEAKDQLGEKIATDITYTLKVMNSVPGLNLSINNQSSNADGIWNLTQGDNYIKATTANNDLDASVQLVITASQSNGRDITRVVTLRVRKINMNDTNARNNDKFELVLGQTHIDMNFLTFADWEGIGKLESSISVIRSDRDGFYVNTETIDGSGDYSYRVTYNGMNIAADNKATVVGNKFCAYTVSGSSVSGGAITKTIEKAKVGVYKVELYKKDKNDPSKWNLSNWKNIVVNDTTVIPTVNIKNTKVSSIDTNSLKNILNDKNNMMTFHRGNDEVKDINVIYVEGTPSNDRIYVTKILVEETIKTGDKSIKDYKYTYWINIGKTFYLNY